MMIMLVLLGIVALVGIAATVVDLARDGYRGVATRPPRSTHASRVLERTSH